MGDYMSANVQGDMGMHRRNAQKLDALFENAREKILSESYSANLNPIVGLTFPLLKRYWVNCVYKDFVPTEVATQPVVKSLLSVYTYKMRKVKILPSRSIR